MTVPCPPQPVRKGRFDLGHRRPPRAHVAGTTGAELLVPGQRNGLQLLSTLRAIDDGANEALLPAVPVTWEPSVPLLAHAAGQHSLPRAPLPINAFYPRFISLIDAKPPVFASVK